MSVKKFFLSLVLSVLSLGMVFAAGSSQQAAGASATGGPLPISLVVYQYGPMAEHPKILEWFEKKFNVDLQVWDLDPNSRATQLNLKLAANEIPDYFLIDGGFAAWQQYYDQDILAEIKEEDLKKGMPLWYNGGESRMPGFLKYFRKNGKIYGLPQSIIENWRLHAIYRGDWMKNLGVSKTPATLDEMEKLMYAFTNSDPDKNGKKDTYGLSASGFGIVYGAYGLTNGIWIKKGNTLEYSSIQPGMKEALGVLAKWYKDGVVDPEFITGENKGGYWAFSHAFFEGRIGYTSHGSFYHWIPGMEAQCYTEFKKINPAAADSIVWGDVLEGPYGKGVLQEGRAKLTGVAAFGKQVEKAPEKMMKWFEIQNWLNESEENYLTAFMGFKGEDWDYVDNHGVKVPTLKPGTTTASISAQGGWNIIKNFGGPNEYKWGLPLYAVNIPKYDLNKNILENELRAPLPSASRYNTELNKIENEARIAIITGAKPLSYFDEFVAQWKAAGGDILTKEANDWWKSIN
jgi:putative aldouronate transport system substrate-binding protein